MCKEDEGKRPSYAHFWPGGKLPAPVDKEPKEKDSQETQPCGHSQTSCNGSS